MDNHPTAADHKHGKNGGMAKKWEELTSVQQVAIELYGRGLERPHIAKLLAGHVFPDLEDGPARKAMRKKLVSWEQTKWFRDILYQKTQIKMDLVIPQVMEGVAARGKMGHVDAAKLILQMAGRFEEDGAANQSVQINIGVGVPRPASFQGPTKALAEGATEEVVDAEWEEAS